MLLDEVLTLRPQDVDLGTKPAEVFVSGTIERTISDGLARKRNEYRERRIAIPEFARSVLARHLDAALREGQDFLFATPTGDPHQRHDVTRAFRAFLETNRNGVSRLGLNPDTMTFDSFRRAAVTALITDAGFKLASQQSGHAHFRTTGTHYSTPTQHMNREAVAAITRAFPSLNSGD